MLQESGNRVGVQFDKLLCGEYQGGTEQEARVGSGGRGQRWSGALAWGPG